MWQLRTVFCEREESVACGTLLSLQVRLAELKLWAHEFSAEGARALAGYTMSPAGSALTGVQVGSLHPPSRSPALSISYAIGPFGATPNMAFPRFGIV